LLIYYRARIEAFQPSIIRNSFAAASLIPIDPQRVLTKLNISLRTPSPPSSRPSSRSSELTLQNAKNYRPITKASFYAQGTAKTTIKQSSKPIKNYTTRGLLPTHTAVWVSHSVMGTHTVVGFYALQPSLSTTRAQYA
jgi:hypothetical protein